MKMNANQIAYDAALDTFRAASAKFRAVTAAYRALEIGDDEFLAAKAVFNAALAASDEAEAIYVANYVEEAEVEEVIESTQIDLFA
jgi:hypothetical protein